MIIMAVYDSSGNALTSVYDASGNELSHVYDSSGALIYTDGTLRVMSFNVGCFYSQYFPCPDAVQDDFYNRHQTIFNNTQPDLCGMPEWNNAIGTIPSSQLMDEFWSDYYSTYVYSVATAALTFASKYELQNISVVQYTDQDDNTRYYEKAYITVNGHNICFVNTHLGTSSIRNSQFVELLDMLENEEYFICVGDFNFRMETVGDSEYNLSVQLALDRGFHSAQSADGLFMTGYHGETAETSSSIVALDNIITSANLPISNVSVDTTKLTDGLCEANGIIIDHLPIMCDVTVE